jgi:hypothetical protein
MAPDDGPHSKNAGRCNDAQWRDNSPDPLLCGDDRAFPPAPAAFSKDKITKVPGKALYLYPMTT